MGHRPLSLVSALRQQLDIYPRAGRGAIGRLLLSPGETPASGQEAQEAADLEIREAETPGGHTMEMSLDCDKSVGLEVLILGMSVSRLWHEKSASTRSRCPRLSPSARCQLDRGTCSWPARMPCSRLQSPTPSPTPASTRHTSWPTSTACMCARWWMHSRASPCYQTGI